MIGALILRIALVCFAYFVAVVAASLFFVGATIGPDALSPHLGQPVWDHALKIGLVTGLVASFAGAITTPPFLVSAAIAEAFRIRGLVFHLATGTVVGAVAAYVWDDSGDRINEPKFLVAAAAGAIGALAYWLIAGRRAGLWRERALQRQHEAATAKSPEPAKPSATPEA